jgi:hypothetical protein
MAVVLEPSIARELVKCAFCSGLGKKQETKFVDVKQGITVDVNISCEYCEGRTMMVKETIVTLFPCSKFNV